MESLPLLPALAFGGGCALFAVTRGAARQPFLRVGLAYLIAAAIATALTATLLHLAPELQATYRYVAGLFLIAVSVIVIRRAPNPGVDFSAGGDDTVVSIRIDIVLWLFATSLLLHCVEAPSSTVQVGLVGGVVAAVLVCGTLTLVRRWMGTREDVVAADRRVRQAGGLLLLIVSVYLAWP